MCLTEKQERALESIAQSIQNIDETIRLYGPLAVYLLPMKREMDLSGYQTDNRFVTLNVSMFKKQYEAGIDRCLGIDIIWEQDAEHNNEIV